MSPTDVTASAIASHRTTAPPARLHAPRRPEEAASGSLPILASIAPVVGSLALFAITRSPVTLVFAALGPLIAVAGFVDARWTRRRRGRRARAAYRVASEDLERDIERAHAAEREELRTLHPAGRALDLLDGPDSARWRVPDHRRTLVSVGRGETASSVRVDAAADDERWAWATRLPDAPVVVDAAEGIGIVGGRVLARAVARSILIQLGRQLPPHTAEFTRDAAPGSDVEASPWAFLDELPHRSAAAPADPLHSGRELEAVRVSVAERWQTEAVAPARQAGRPPAGGVLVALSDTVELIPTRCRHLLVLDADGRTTLADGTGASPSVAVAPTLLAEAEAQHLVGALAAAALTTGESPMLSSLPSSVPFAEVGQVRGRRPPDAADWAPHALRVPIGLGADGEVTLDLAADGPHALVGGTTGSGKSELLITWITALAARSSPRELSLLLVDCKGGASFGAVESLPHVVGMVTDLEPGAAERVVSSLRAELRHRERILARFGARHLLDSALAPDDRPARLVVVVDEFQALLDASPHLHQVFADLAARGRSLGLHLILCSQRPAAVAADAILANCTLRLSLRVTSRQDSTAVLGVPDAAALPAGTPGRCIAWNGEERIVFQAAVTSPGDLTAVRERWRDADRPRRPWLDPLPHSLPLRAVLEFDSGPTDGEPSTVDSTDGEGIVFGLADLPEEQAQRPAIWRPSTDGSLLVLGAGRSGRTSFLDTVEAAARGRWRVERVAHDAEQGWDVIMALSEPLRPPERTLLLIDDVESLLATAGDEHGAALREAILTLLRDGGRRGVTVVLVASRVGGVVHRFSAHLDSTVVLRLADRQDHLVAGAPASCFDPRRPAGRAHWQDAEVQIAITSPLPHRVSTTDAHRWRPSPGSTTVVVTRAPGVLRSALQQRGTSHGEVRLLEPAAEPFTPPLAAGRRTEDPRHDDQGALIVLVDPETWSSGRLVVGRDLPPRVARAELVIHACSAADFRQVTRSRELPPLLGYASGRAWWWRAGEPTRRVDLLDG